MNKIKEDYTVLSNSFFQSSSLLFLALDMSKRLVCLVCHLQVISFLTLSSIAIVNSTQQDSRKRRGLPCDKHGRAINSVFCRDLHFIIKLTFQGL